MDINYLLHRQQVELMRANLAKCSESRIAHLELAQRYRSLVDDHRRAATLH